MLRSRAAEKEYVAVGVLEFGASQTVMGVFERNRKSDASRRKLGGQGVRIWDREVSVRSGLGFALGVGSGLLRQI